ncbi:hypothetical protein BQ8482_300011 [Mesorhizobium delmotii]|uniref:DNA-binding protein n=1 Tax=Mesorhizobium delmotii TaxID=1631247 RepID=A0A2P9ANA3_9HYPH|nr:hypothetical protein BQ8482_300011 [Mesorhizobium delmotii]
MKVANDLGRQAVQSQEDRLHPGSLQPAQPSPAPAGLWSAHAQEVAEHFAIAETTVHHWGRQGLITKVCSDSLNRGLWDIPHNLDIIKGRPGRNAVAARRASITVPSTEQDSL